MRVEEVRVDEVRVEEVRVEEMRVWSNITLQCNKAMSASKNRPSLQRDMAPTAR